MTDITITVDDEVFRRANHWAEAAHISVPVMIEEFLRDIAEKENASEDFKQEIMEFRAKLIARGSRFSASDRLPREQLYDRHASR